MQVIAYTEVEGKRYFIGLGNTKRTARVVAEGNLFELDRFSIEHSGAHYTNEHEAQGYTHFAELLGKV